MRRSFLRAALTALGSLASALVCAADAAGDAPAEITLTAPRGHTVGGVPPLIEMSASEIDSYGVDTLSDLVSTLRPLTRSTRSDQLAVVLINGRLAGQTEFDNLPREAIERVEVLPESVALQYGFSENQRVLNFVLREDYRAVPARVSDSGATEGGLQTRSADASFVALEDEARVTLLASGRDSGWLRDSDRNVSLPDAHERTLVAAKTDAKVAGTVSHAFPRASASLEASLDKTGSAALQGVAGGRTLEQHIPETTARFATQLTGKLGQFVWDATAFYLNVNSRSSSDTGVRADGEKLIDRTRAAFNAGNVQLSLSGLAGSLPAGGIVANVKLAYQHQGFATRTLTADAALATRSLVRSVRSASANAHLPIASRDAGVLPALGDLAGTFNLAIDSVSSFGTLVSTSYGLDWTPVRKLHLNFIYTDHQTAPTAQQLQSPPLITPHFEMFDFISGETADVTQVTGGNDALAATSDRRASAGVALGPLGKTTFSAHYERNRIHNAIGALPPITTDVELAFPERFVRNADGQLVEIDGRWVSFEREVTDDLKWGFNVRVPLGEPIPHTPSNRVELSLFDTWTIDDRTLIRGGLPELDLLNGAPSDITGGQPRHVIEARALLYRNGFGAALNAQWRSATCVASGDLAAPNPIQFSSLGTADLRIFAELDRIPLTRSWSWTSGTRISLAVTNAFDARQTARDTNGVTPIALEPGFLDPAGRVVALSGRKVFAAAGG